MGFVHFGGNNNSFFLSSLGQTTQTSDFVAYFFPLNAVAYYWWKYLLLPLGLLYGWFVFFQPYTIPISAILSQTCIL